MCVCGGSGGVGKTTSAAAIALGMAAAGAKVAVVTIDPAKRLANALGLAELENEPRRVPARRLKAEGLEIEGQLWAMMLDPKRTFDELIDRIAPDPERAAEIKANRVYGELSTAVSGSQEFTAVAKLYDLDQSGRFDLLVLDTPPSRNALDFLDAPGRLTSFLDGRALKAFILPTGLGMRVLGRGATPLLAALRRVTGIDLLSDLSTFFQLLGDMTNDFSLRAARVEQMLRAETTAFVLVTSAQREPIDEAIWFRRTLEKSGLPFSGVIVNRVHHDRSVSASRATSPPRSGGCCPASWSSGSPRTSTTTTCSRTATRATSRAYGPSSAHIRCCSSPTWTTTSTTSRDCCGCIVTCSRRRPSASGCLPKSSPDLVGRADEQPVVPVPAPGAPGQQQRLPLAPVDLVAVANDLH